MKVAVGSQNKNKIAAVQEALVLYPKIFIDAEVVGVGIDIEEFGHPKNISEITDGAVARAKKAFGNNVSYSFGIESGLMSVQHTKSGYVEIAACAIYDGVQVTLGFAPAFEWPKGMTEKILEGGIDGSAAFKALGYTDEENKIGAMEGGIIGRLTNGRMTREQQTVYSIIMAMVQIEKKEMYS